MMLHINTEILSLGHNKYKNSVEGHGIKTGNEMIRILEAKKQKKKKKKWAVIS